MWREGRINRLLLVVILLMLTVVLAPGAGAQEPEEPGEAEPPEQPATTLIRASASPFMRPPAEIGNAEPILPYDGPPGEPVADPTATVIYTPATGETVVVPSDAPGALFIDEEARSALSFPGLAAAIATGGRESVLGGDDRVRRTDTGNFPWRTIARLVVRWVPGGSVGACTGALISDFHVLTAGHCVFDYGGTDDWAHSIQIFPGLDDDEMPYNFAWSTFYRSYTGWTDSGMTEHDWAVITLDRSVGTYTGWMGRQTDSSSSSIYTGTLNVSGYPGTPPVGVTCPTWANCQFWDADSGHSASTDNHWYSMDTSGGMSGGPVWRYLSGSGERYILTTHTCGTGGCGIASNSVNHGTRLNNDKYDRIFTWISEDAGITPNDRADLIDDGQPYSGFNPSSVYNGQSFIAWSDVRNIGTASSGSFYVSYYASTNTTITTGDHLIGDDWVGSISPFTYANSELSLSFPAGIPDGDYYVGWIIDRFGVVPEFDEANNTAYKTGYQLSVCNKAPTPLLLAPGNGFLTDDRTPSFDWSDSSGAASYRIQVDDSGAFSSPVIDVPTKGSSFTPSSSLAYDTYYWRVRADKGCGTLGDWSATRTLTITPVCDMTQIARTTITGLMIGGACRELRGGPLLTIAGTANVSLEAGSMVALYEDFQVDSGASLEIRTCGHSLCDTGSPFDPTCHSCVTAVCDAYPYCCGKTWDAKCVGAVGSVCRLLCPSP